MLSVPPGDGGLGNDSTEPPRCCSDESFPSPFTAPERRRRGWSRRRFLPRPRGVGVGVVGLRVISAHRRGELGAVAIQEHRPRIGSLELLAKSFHDRIGGAQQPLRRVALPAPLLSFVASRDGISHNPAEFSRTEDLTAAAEILWALVTADA